MKSIVIGLGETGKPLQKVLGCAGADSVMFVPEGQFDIINICIPYSDNFIDIVEFYQEKYSPRLTIIHTTVPIGTTSQLTNAVHSPILGDHTNMKESILTFTKWIGGRQAEKAKTYFETAGISCETVSTSEETEFMKLMCLAKYGISISFSKYQKEIADKYGIDFRDVMKWDMNYNNGLKLLGKEHLVRPLINPVDGPIGGHCVVQNTKFLNSQHPNSILNEILKYDMATV
jgi:hypothetical protein